MLTEKGGEIAGKYELATTSEAAATNYKKIVDGFKAMGDLFHSDVPAVTNVIDSLATEARGESFTAAFQISTEAAEAAVKAMLQRKKAGK